MSVAPAHVTDAGDCATAIEAVSNSAAIATTFAIAKVGLLENSKKKKIPRLLDSYAISQSQFTMPACQTKQLLLHQRSFQKCFSLNDPQATFWWQRFRFSSASVQSRSEYSIASSSIVTGGTTRHCVFYAPKRS